MDFSLKQNNSRIRSENKGNEIGKKYLLFSRSKWASHKSTTRRHFEKPLISTSNELDAVVVVVVVVVVAAVTVVVVFVVTNELDVVVVVFAVVVAFAVAFVVTKSSHA